MKILTEVSLPCGKRQSPVKRITSLIKATINTKTDEELAEILKQQFVKLHLMNDEGTWYNEKFATYSKRLLTPISKEIAIAYVDEVAKHVEKNAYLVSFLEAATKENFKVLTTKYSEEGAEILPKAVIYGIALNNLTNIEVENPLLLKEILKLWQSKRKELNLHLLGDMKLFGYAKLTTIEMPIKTLISFHESGKVNPSFFKRLLPVNIMEAIMKDMTGGYFDNATAALPLMTNGPTSKVNKKLGTGPARWNKDKSIVLVKTPLSKIWNDLYQSWNMSFCSQYGTFPFFFQKHLIPILNNYQKNSTEFAYKRIISLYTHIHYYYFGKKYDAMNGISKIKWHDKELTKLWGKMNKKFAKDYSKKIKISKNSG